MASAIRCTHKESEAVGFSQEHRSQLANKRAAFERCTSTPEFQAWLKLEGMKRSGALAAVEAEIKRKVNLAMRASNLKVEVGDGKTWHGEAEECTHGS